MGQHPNPDPDPDLDKDEDDLEALGTPFYQGNGLTVRALTAEELQQFLDAHTDQPAELLGSGWAAPRPTGHPAHGSSNPSGSRACITPTRAGAPGPAGHRHPGLPRPFGPHPLPAPPRAELAAWTPSLTWRAPWCWPPAWSPAPWPPRPASPGPGSLG